jgi:hypothetical protein
MVQVTVGLPSDDESSVQAEAYFTYEEIKVRASN